MRLGILGGTFDPVHEGHLAMVRAAAAAARLDRVLLIPCARPPHKERPDLTDGYHRLAMLALLVPLDPIVSVSSIELRRGGISYTIDTLRDLHADHPRADLLLIVGSDSFAEMATWRDHDEILARVAIAVIRRPGAGAESLQGRLPSSLEKALRPAGAVWPGSFEGMLPFASVAECTPVEISSTEIRNRVREGRPIGGMVPAPVETYIHRQGLYGPSPTR